MAVLLNRFADGRRVNDWKHLLNMLGTEAEIQHLIAVMHVVEVQVLGQVIRLRRILCVDPLELISDRHDTRRQQAGETKRLSLLDSEGSAPIGQRVRQHLLATGRNP